MRFARVVAGLCRRVLPLAVAVMAIAGLARPAGAFKPYTHVYVAQQALADVLDDGHVTVNGQEYAVDPVLLAALQQWPSYYNAGVIGPDGFPDLTMGQSVIHPENTGAWLRYLLQRAQEAQTDPQYTAAERGQILAWTFGFMTHAAGDMWAHTMVNEFAREVFPAVSEIVTSVDDAAIALRHIMVEGYIADATPGYDGNPDITLYNGDWTDDSTPGIQYDAPHKFIYNTLVKKDNGAPSNDRGPLLDYFYALRAQLVSKLQDPNPDPLEAAISSYDGTRDALNELTCDCNFGSSAGSCDTGALDAAADLVNCPVGLLKLGFNVVIESFEAFLNFVGATIALAFDAMVDAYIKAWIDDIDRGLENWSHLGLASTRALFDPQARRDAQNDECDSYGADGSVLRNDCESGIGAIDVIFFKCDPFINEYLLSMLGAPDVVGDLRAILDEAADFLDTILGPYLNPLRLLSHELKEWAKDLLFDYIKQRYGFDIEAMKAYFESPSSKMDVTSIDLTLPGGSVESVELFRPDDHEKLDAYLGLVNTHHDGPGGGLADDDVFNPNVFAAYKNSVLMSKLLLLSGPGMDGLVSDLVGQPVTYYAGDAQGNIMTTPLYGVGPAHQWLKSIDSDHAWRQDGRPTFTDPGHHPGGEGNFPLWESCILRDSVFRTLFVDWENPPSQNFPDLFDNVSVDPNDPDPPTSTLVIDGVSYNDGMGNIFIPGATDLVVDGGDDFWPDDSISVAIEIRPDGSPTGTAGTYAIGDSLNISGNPDGRYHFDLSASDPCRTEAEHTLTYVLDTAPPEVTFIEPSQPQYDTDDFSSIQFTLDDGPLGSGVAMYHVTLDGQMASNGQAMDFFFFNPGEHVIIVTSTDNVGNTGTDTLTFVVRATSESLLSNLDRALDLGLITSEGVHNSMRAKVEAALKSHNEGRHATEWKQLNALANELSAQSGQFIDEETAQRFIAFVYDLINSQEAGSMSTGVEAILEGGLNGTR